jgi:hypothetical protein
VYNAEGPKRRSSFEHVSAQRPVGERGVITMATIPGPAVDDDRDIDYPTRDGKPMGETDLHRKKMQDLISTLEDYFSRDSRVYVSGNLLVFY